MPSQAQIHNRRINALKRIDAVLGTSIAALNVRQNDVKIMKQFEMVADAVESALSQDTVIEGDGSGDTLPDYDSWSRAELEAELADLGIPLDSIEGTGANGNVVKDDLVNALFNAEKDFG